MFRFFAAAFLLIACLGINGCTQDAAIAKFVADLDSATKEIVKPVDDSPTVSGVDAAQKVLDAKRPGLRSQLDGLLKGKASSGMAEKMTASVKANVAEVLGLQAKYRVEALNDDAFRTKLEKLGDDFVDLLKTQ